MAREITVRELIDRLSEGHAVLIRGMVWNVAGVKQQTDRSDGTMRTQLRLTRSDPDGASRKLMLDVEMNDTIRLANDPAS